MSPMETPSPTEIPRSDLDAVRQFLTSDGVEPRGAAPAQASQGQRLVPLSHGISRARRRAHASSNTNG
jgi:hypothetical protein